MKTTDESKPDAERIKAIEKIFEETAPLLRFYSMSVLSNYHLAEESVNNTFIVAWIKADILLGCDDPKAWIMKVHKNLLANALRSKAVENRYVTSLLPIEELPHASTDDDKTYRLMYEDLISKEDYELLEMRIIQGKPMEEIAAELGVSISACRKRFSRAKQRLKDALKDNE